MDKIFTTWILLFSLFIHSYSQQPWPSWNTLHNRFSTGPTAAEVDKTGDFGGIKPQSYILTLQGPMSNVPYNGVKGFKGDLKLKFFVARPTTIVYLHAKELTISLDKISLADDSGRNVRIKEKKLKAPSQILMIRLKRPLIIHSTYEVRIPNFSAKLQGGYKMGVFQSFVHHSPTKHQYAAVTQFQMDNARRVFPCIDMPQFKSNFTMTLIHPPDTTALSNTEVSHFSRPKDGWHVTHFFPTPGLPTYTVGFVILPQAYKMVGARSQNNLPLQLWYNRYEISDSLAQQLFNYTLYSYNYLQDTFGHYLPMKKLDLVTVAQFAVQGMENYGLITLNQDYVKTHWPTFRLSLISHEIAHQWISNLITIETWNDMCLQEAVTDHYARETVKRYFGKESSEWNQYYLEKYISALVLEDKNIPPRDLLLSDNPSLGEVSSTCFGKAVFLVDGLSTLVGDNIFDVNIRKFLGHHRDGHFNLDDFNHQINRILVDRKHPASKVFDFWYRHGGYPSLFVARDYRSKNVNLEQRSVFPKAQSYAVTRDIWPIPLKFKLRSGNWKSPYKLMNGSNAFLNKIPTDGTDWLLANPNFGYFYRVNYDLHNWKLLGEALQRNPRQFSPVTRAQIVGDFCFFNKLGIIQGSERVRKVIMNAVYSNSQYFTRFSLYMGSCRPLSRQF